MFSNFVLSLLLIIFNKKIICRNATCFEYSCEECNSPEYGNCTKCRYGWNLIDGTCPCYSPGCALCYIGFASSNVCQLCKNGYDFQKHKCICNISNCEHCGQNNCLVCSAGYFYNTTSNKCEKQKDEEKIPCYDPNCDACFSKEKGACVNCKEGFTQRKGECIELIKPGKYGSCPNNYYRKGDFCFQDFEGMNCSIDYFSEYYCPSNKCLKCSEEKQLIVIAECDNSAECSSIKGCLNCITKDECLICNQGYYLLGGLCYKCTEGCSICSNNQTCQYCMSGFELNSDKKCVLTYNFDFNIDLYNQFKQELVQKECTDNKCLYCTYRYDIETCGKCINGYGPNGIKCFHCFDKCIDCYYWSRMICRECISGYRVDDKGGCELICSDENCLNCYLDDGKEICKKCKNNYKPNGKNCSLCSDINCDNCYFLKGKEYCTKCPLGYRINEEKCIKCSDSNCLECDLSNGKEYCKNCKNFYRPENEKCLKCLDERCYSCQLKLGKEKCSNCEYNYHPNEEKCLPCSLENCKNCYFHDGKEICFQCYYDYKINDGICSLCSLENCKDCYFYNKKENCIECENGYELNNGNCELICSDENCLSCSKTQNIEYCNNCKEGYKIENEKCIKCEDENCKKCDENKKVCTLCKNNSKLSNGKCIFKNYFCMENCKSCSTSGECLKCDDGYKLDNSGKDCIKEKSKKTIYIILIIIVLCLFIALIVFCFINKFKNRQINSNRNQVRIIQNEQNNNNIILFTARNQNFSSSLKKTNLYDEFEIQKRKIEGLKHMPNL